MRDLSSISTTVMPTANLIPFQGFNSAVWTEGLTEMEGDTRGAEASRNNSGLQSTLRKYLAQPSTGPTGLCIAHSTEFPIAFFAALSGCDPWQAPGRAAAEHARSS